MHENVKKLKNFAVFVIFGSFWGLWVNQKKSIKLYKYISHDTNFTSVSFLGETDWDIDLENYNFCLKRPLDLYIFLSHTKYEWKLTIMLMRYSLHRVKLDECAFCNLFSGRVL